MPKKNKVGLFDLPALQSSKPFAPLRVQQVLGAREGDRTARERLFGIDVGSTVRECKHRKLVAVRDDAHSRILARSPIPAGITFFHSAATCLHVPTRLTRESTKREGRKPRVSERHVVGCCEVLARALAR